MIGETVKTYDFKKMVVVIGGVPFMGFADEGITITQPEDTFSDTVGADGTIVRTNLGNNQSEITINLQKTNPLNGHLLALHTTDRNTNKGVVSFSLKDLNGSTAFFTKSAWVTKPADLNAKKEAETVVWNLKTGKCYGGEAGSSISSSLLG